MSREQETEIIEQYKKLVHSVAARKFYRWQFDEDLIQCGLIGLWEAAQKWDGAKNFTAFARVCIYRNMLDYVRSKAAQPSGEELPDTFSYEEEYSNLDNLELLEKIGNAFIPGTREHIILAELALGASKKDLAQSMNMDTPQVSKIAKQAVKRIL